MPHGKIYQDVTHTVGNTGKLVVSVICDFGERYLSHPVYTELPDPDISDLDEALSAPTAVA